MKKYCLLLLALFPLFASCEKESVPGKIDLEDPNAELYTISFGTDGIQAEEGTKAIGSNTVYGINVIYYKNGTKQGVYAYGLFNDLSNAKITLIGGYTYDFKCTIVQPGSHHLWYGPYGKNNFSGYAEPFQLNDSDSTPCTNEFVVGTGKYLAGIYSGTAVVAQLSDESKNSKHKYPSLKRYYGEQTGFNPATDGTHVVIPLVKAYFGCQLTVNGIVDGSVTSSWSGDNDIWFLKLSNRTSNYKGGEYIITFPDVEGCWKNNSYSMSKTLAWTYTSVRSSYAGSPTYWNMSGTKSITFKRNVMTKITLNLNVDRSWGGISTTVEDIGDDNVINFGVDNNYNLVQK